MSISPDWFLRKLAGEKVQKAQLTVENRAHAEGLTGMREGSIVYNQELGAKMAFRNGVWVTFTDGDPMSNRLDGYVFCLTGKMWTTREKVESLIQAAGGRVARTMKTNAILVQGAVAGAKTNGIKSKKQLDAERNSQRVIEHEGLRAVLAGTARVDEVLGGFKTRPKPKPTPVEPIDRDKQKRKVKQVFDDIEAIAFGK